MNTTKICKINMSWENDTWIAELINGEFDLILESNSYDALVERVKIAIQDVLEVDFKYTGDIQFIFQTERIDNLKARAS